MPRYIDADSLKRAVHNEWDDCLVWDESGSVTADEMERIIDAQPTVDAEPVVRCDDCIYRDGKTPGQPNILCWQMHVDDFCSYGRRADESKEQSKCETKERK